MNSIADECSLNASPTASGGSATIGRLSSNVSIGSFARFIPPRARPSRRLSWYERVRRPRTRRLTYAEKLTLSPLAKLRRFGRLPFKLIVHIVIIALSTSFILLHGYEFSAFLSANERSFKDVLQHDPSPNPQGNTAIFSVDSLLAHIQKSTTGYFNYHNHTIGEVQTTSFVLMELEFWNGTSTENFVSKDDPLGVLDGDTYDHRRVIDALKYITITFTFSNRLSEQSNNPFGPFQTVDFEWICTGRYDFTDDAETVFHLAISSKLTSGGITKLIIIDCVTCSFCIISILLGSRALFKSREVYLYARRRLRDPDPDLEISPTKLTWSMLTWKDHLAFFNLWHVCTMTGDTLLVLGCLLGLLKQFQQTETAHHYMTSEQMFRSFGIFLEWFSLIKYMEFDIEFYMLIVAVRASMTRVIKFVIMTLPMYAGYTFVGMHCFSSHTDLFGDLHTSARTLFALLNGDSVLMVYQDLCLVNDLGYCLFSQFYLYTFCLMFIVVILNVFIFIIETGYEKAQLATTSESDENPVMLDHERLRRILEAADRAAGVNVDELDGLPEDPLIESSSLLATLGDPNLNVADPDNGPPLSSCPVPLQDLANKGTRLSSIGGIPTLEINEIIRQSVKVAIESLQSEVPSNDAVDKTTAKTIFDMENRIHTLKSRLKADEEAHAKLREALQTEFAIELVKLTEQTKEIEHERNEARAVASALLLEVKDLRERGVQTKSTGIPSNSC